MRKVFIVTAIFILLILCAVLIKVKRDSGKITTGDEKISIATSFYPIYYFTKEIAGEEFNIINITPNGAEPHDYEPTTKDVSFISSADLTIINGVNLEPWASKVPAKKLVSISDGIATQKINEEGEMIKDPHIWLDPVLAQEMVKKITEALIELYPSKTTLFQENEISLIARLQKLDNEFKKGLSDCLKNEVVTSHAAFGYLASRYGFSQIAISGVSPEEEPSARKLAEIAGIVRKNNIKYIFFETLVSPRLAQTLAREVGAETLLFNPLEGLGSEERENADYFTVQRENLANLRTALSCMQ